jgi:hypothetical protein
MIDKSTFDSFDETTYYVINVSEGKLYNLNYLKQLISDS